MKVKCPDCEAKLTIADPDAPSPHGVIHVECPDCGTRFGHSNPKGDDAHTVTETVSVPGERAILAGERISRAEAVRLGLVEGDDK